MGRIYGDSDPMWLVYSRIANSIREPDYRPWDWRIAYNYWKQYRRMVTNDWPWQVGQKVLVTNFSVYGVSCGSITAKVVGIDEQEDKCTMFRVQITGRKSRWYKTGEIIRLRGYDITSR